MKYEREGKGMPNIGDKTPGTSIGKKAKRAYIWCACPDCSKERWVICAKGGKEPLSKRCNSCYLKYNKSHWKGGRIFDRVGYIFVRIPPADFFFPMVTLIGYAYEHHREFGINYKK